MFAATGVLVFLQFINVLNGKTQTEYITNWKLEEKTSYTRDACYQEIPNKDFTIIHMNNKYGRVIEVGYDMEELQDAGYFWSKTCEFYKWCHDWNYNVRYTEEGDEEYPALTISINKYSKGVKSKGSNVRATMLITAKIEVELERTEFSWLCLGSKTCVVELPVDNYLMMKAGKNWIRNLDDVKPKVEYLEALFSSIWIGNFNETALEIGIVKNDCSKLCEVCRVIWYRIKKKKVKRGLGFDVDCSELSTKFKPPVKVLDIFQPTREIDID